MNTDSKEMNQCFMVEYKKWKHAKFTNNKMLMQGEAGEVKGVKFLSRIQSSVLFAE